ncbi:unnamed protein product [Diatraea saccharalis]|uniref:CHK kinase-like domain-containing protein n=1 Tax=Diatraea saccharalis TaxID=40085 RepID=A0A9N9RG62_9NEOP|nr:unnamed protein product [Diatraea saccharalis]
MVWLPSGTVNMMDVHQKVLQRTLHDIAEEKGYDHGELKVLPVSTGGASYTSQLYCGKMSAPNKEDLKFFAKVATLGKDARSMIPTSIYFTEQYVYRKLAGVYEKIEDKHQVTSEHRFVFPVVYGYSDTDMEEVIVMQDLTAEGFTVQDRFSSFDWHYASAAVQQIARFHALSIAMQHDFPADYAELTEKIKFQKTLDQSMSGMFLQTVYKSVELVKEEYKERLREYLKIYLPKAIATYHDTPPRPVLNHGDFRMSNIMHKKRQDDGIEVILIDYQILHIASAVKDLMHFIFTGSDAAFRRQYYHKLLEHYYQQLSHALTRLHLDPGIVLSKEDFDADMKENSHLGLVFALYTIPVVTVAEEQAPVPGEVLGLKNLMQTEATQLCKDRLNEVVEDYITWGVI